MRNRTDHNSERHFRKRSRAAQQAAVIKMSAYPINTILRVIRGKWKPMIILALRRRTLCYGELRRLLPQVTKKVLTEQLRELERERIVSRRVLMPRIIRVEYSLTDHGLTLLSVLAL